MLRNPFASVPADTVHNASASTQLLDDEQIEHASGTTLRQTQSYVQGRGDVPLAFMTVPQLLQQTRYRYGSSTAVVFPAQNISLSWSQLHEQADKLAAGLLALGIRHGNRVAIWSPNRVEWIITQFGTARIGAVLVNINPAYQRHELDYAMNEVRARVLIMARAHGRSDYLSIIKELAPEIDHAKDAASCAELYLHAMPALKHIVVLDNGELPGSCLAWESLLALAGPAQKTRLDSITNKLDPDDAINIQFTSGTTGSPKAATLSHYNIVNNARNTAAAMHLDIDDTVCIPVPLYHCFGMVLGVLSCCSTGASMVFPGGSFRVDDTLEAVSRYRCTALYGVPTMFIAMLEQLQLKAFDISSLRTGIMAGAPCPVDTMRKVIYDMNMEEITIAYGMTETSPVSFQTAIDDPIEKRVTTVGKIQPHVEAKIVDESGAIVPRGKSGELCTRGYLVMLGYWNIESKNANNPIDPAGWMHTGDLAILDAEGYCSIVGRVNDMIIRGGENIYPREIEEFLLAHPLIKDVQVFGIPDERLGETVCAWIILQADDGINAEQVIEFCRASIAHYKIPTHVCFVDEFPQTVTGKARKIDMCNTMIKELGLQALIS